MAITSPRIRAEVIDDINATAEEISDYACGHGLSICRDELFGRIDRLSVDHLGSWQNCIDQARGAGATIIYVHADTADPDALLSPIADRAGLLVDELDGSVRYAYDDPWLNADDGQKVRTASLAIVTWIESKQSELSKGAGDAETLLVLWVLEGIVHTWSAIARQWDDTLAMIRDESESLLTTLAQAQSEIPGFTTSGYDVRARQMAEHPRYHEATNESKRGFMAARLFSVDEYEARQIAERAVLLHWWDIEPSQREARRVSIQSLQAEGLSVRAIAQHLGLTEAKVRAALNDV